MTNAFTLLRSTVAFAVAAGATLLIVAGSAAPVAAAELRSVTVETDGIDLTSRAGSARIEAGIGRAARSVCSTGDDRALAAQAARQRCIKDAIDAAMPHLDSLAASARNARQAAADAAPAPAPVGR